MKTVLLITNIPTPYRIPLFNELKRQFEPQGIRLVVVFAALTYPRRKWAVDLSECAFEYLVLPEGMVQRRNSEGPLFTYPKLLTVIRKFNPSLVVVAGFSIATIKLWLLSWLQRTPFVIWSGAIERKGQKDSILRRMQRRLLVKRAQGFVAYGTRAKAYLASLGATANDVTISTNTVDTEYYHQEVDKLRSQDARDSNKKYLLYVGHLTRGKCIDKLFCAIQMLVKLRQDFELHIVGSGPEETLLRTLAHNMNISTFVVFEGYKQKQDIPHYLAKTDLFLFPSEYDVWGLVLIEAMAASISCLSSVYAGATADLIKDGVTGFCIDFSNTQGVAKKIAWILDNYDIRKRVGETARRYVQRTADIKSSAASFVAAILKAMHRPHEAHRSGRPYFLPSVNLGQNLPLHCSSEAPRGKPRGIFSAA